MIANVKASHVSAKLPPLSIVRMLWKHRWLAGVCWIIASVAAIVVSRLLPSTYRAEAIVLVDSQKIPESFVSSTVGGDIADRLALISQDIMSSARLLEIIRTFKLYVNPGVTLTQEELLRKMHQDISVSVEKSWTGGRMQAFRLGYEGRDPKIVAAVANRLAGLYVTENVRSRESQAEGTVDFLGLQLEEARKSLNEQESKVSQFKIEHNGELPQQENALLTNVGNLRVELQGIQGTISRTQENRLSLDAALSAAESSEAMLITATKRKVNGWTTASADPSNPNADTDVLKERLRALRLRYTPQHPDVKALERELAEATRLESLPPAVPNARSSSTTAPDGKQTSDSQDQVLGLVNPDLLRERERITSLKVQIEIAKRETQSLEKQRQQLVAQLTDCEARITRLPLVDQKMLALKRDYDESANNYNSLLQKRFAAGVATDMERAGKSEQFTVIDPARVPQKAVKPKRALIAAGGSLAGLAIGLLCGFGLEFRKQTFQGEWELPPGTVVLGRVPFVQIGFGDSVSAEISLR